MTLEYKISPRHWQIWQIKLDDIQGLYLLSSKLRDEEHWSLEDAYNTEEEAILAVQNLDKTFPAYHDAGHAPAAFDRKRWVLVD